jgi:TPR repeat protein
MQLRTGAVPYLNRMLRVSLRIGSAALLVAGVLLAGYFYKNTQVGGHSPQQELKRFEKAAATGDTSAMNSLGLAYYEGREVVRDETLARQWFEKAAAAGNTSAMNNLGLIYEHPDSVSARPEYEKARFWFEKAAAAGDAAGMFHLGVMYEESEGVVRNDQTARQLYQKAAAAGNTDAQERLRRLPR